MGIFSRHKKNAADDSLGAAPPVFIRHADHELFKPHHPEEGQLSRRASFSGSSQSLKGLTRRSSLPTVNRGAVQAFSTAGAKVADTPTPLIKSTDTANDDATANVNEPKVELLETLDLPRSPRKVDSGASVGDASYIEEIIDDASYEEEIIEEEYYEEEIIEAIKPELPDREISISFNDYDDVQGTVHINDYTDGEIDKCWYSSDDYDKMVKKARKAVAKTEEEETAKSKKKKKKSKSKENEDEPVEKSKKTKKEEKSKKSDLRGLEAWGSESSKLIRVLKEQAFDAVWNAQSLVWASGSLDPEKLREAYISISAPAQEQASQRGKEDEEAAEKIHGKKHDRRRLGMRKGLLGKTTKLAKKAGRKVTGKKKKEKAEEPEQERVITRQPSRGGRLLMVDDSDVASASVDDFSASFKTETTSLSEKKRIFAMKRAKSYKQDRRKVMSRTPSWESGLSSGKY